MWDFKKLLVCLRMFYLVANLEGNDISSKLNSHIESAFPIPWSPEPMPSIVVVVPDTV